MMAQDMTKVILVLVALGACLALAIFRPPILPPTPSTPSSLPEEPPSVSVQQSQGVLPQQEGPNPGQAEEERRAQELAEREARLNQQAQELTRREEELNRRAQELAEQEHALRRREASLAAQQQELEGLRRWLLTVAIVVGLLATPSIIALILLWKIHREMSDALKSTRHPALARSSAGDNGRGRKEVILSGNGSTRSRIHQ